MSMKTKPREWWQMFISNRDSIIGVQGILYLLLRIQCFTGEHGSAWRVMAVETIDTRRGPWCNFAIPFHRLTPGNIKALGEPCPMAGFRRCLSWINRKWMTRNSWYTYPMIPPIATRTPMIDLSPTARPEVIQPSATIEHVLTWPTTVLETGPVCAMMKNWDMLMIQANNPDCDFIG